MISGKKVLAIIPARGGSKRLPNKNIMKFAGEPLISWTIKAANQSRYIDNVIVSTDDIAIAKISKKFGALVPELRPAALSSDEATSNDVIAYCINKYNEGYEIIILLQPTSPLRNYIHINESLEMYVEKNALTMVSVTPSKDREKWTNVLSPNGTMEEFNDGTLEKTQDKEVFYKINGAIYVMDVNSFMESKTITYNQETYAYEMSNPLSIDIDEKKDFEIAETTMIKLTKNTNSK